MQNNNTQVILSFSNAYISIVLFNSVDNQVNVLYKKNIKIKKGCIKNGYIADHKYVINTVEKLINSATLFTNFAIKKAIISIDCNEITYKQIELNEIKLQDGIFDQTIWNKIQNESIEIQQINDKYIYDVWYNSWIIDDVQYSYLNNNSIAGNKLRIKAKTYNINKILYNSYYDVLKKLNIELLDIRPIISTIASIATSHQINHHELFVYLNDDALNLTYTSGKRIEKIISEKELGLTSFSNIVVNELNISEDILQNVLNKNFISSTNRNDIIPPIISGFQTHNAKLVSANFKGIDNILNDYVKSIINMVNLNVKKLAISNIKISRIIYIPNNEMTNCIFNLTQMYNKSNYLIYDIPDNMKQEVDCIQDYLLINYLHLDYDKQNNGNYVQVLTNKDMRNLRNSMRKGD